MTEFDLLFLGRKIWQAGLFFLCVLLLVRYGMQWQKQRRQGNLAATEQAENTAASSPGEATPTESKDGDS